MIEKLIRKGYTALTSADFEAIAADAHRGEWNVRKAFHVCEQGGYEAVDARGRVHGTDCCGSMAVLSYYKHAAKRRKEGPLLIKAE